MPFSKRSLLIIVAVAIVLGAVGFWRGGGITFGGTAPQLSWPFLIVGLCAFLVSIVGVALLYFSPEDRAIRAAVAGQTATQPGLDRWQQKILLALIWLGVVAVGSAFIWVGWGIKLDGAGPELTLPLVVIIGVVVLLVTLALVAVTFSVLNMSDKGQALALPEGSVRAVIALMLLLIFAIAAIFLYSNVASSGRVRIVDKMSTSNIVDLRKHVTIVLTIPPFVEPVPNAPAAAPGTPAPSYTVYYRDLNSPAGDDIAKQLIVLLGTLVTAVASFYFGSSSVASARDAADRARSGVGGPNATSVSPPALKADGTSQQLTITGANLGNVNAVKLVSGDGKTTISADAGSIRASATSVTCDVTVATTAPGGSYDVVVSDNANNSSTVPKGVAINVAAPSAPPVPAVDEIPLKADGSEQDLNFTASDLPDGVTSVKLTRSDGSPPIEAQGTTITQGADGSLACKITIPGDAKRDVWDIVVSDGTKETTVQGKKVRLTA